MSRQGLMYAAITAASIANFLAIDADNASAHQRWSAPSDQQPLHLAGEIQQTSYGTLHTTVQVKTGDQVWTAILASPSRLQQYGLPEGVLNVGQQINLVGTPLHRGSNEVWAEQIVIGDRTIELA